MKRALHEVAEAAVVGAVDEARLGVKAGRDVLVHGVEFQSARTALGKHLVCWARFMRAVTEFGFAGHSLGLQLPVLPEPELGINTADAVEANIAAQTGAEAVRSGVQLAVSVDHA